MIKFRKYTTISGEFNILEWGWLWVKIQVPHKFGKKGGGAKVSKPQQLFLSEIIDPKLYKLPKNQPPGSIRRADMEGVFPYFDFEKGLLLPYPPPNCARKFKFDANRLSRGHRLAFRRF